MKKTPLLERRRCGILMPVFSLPSPYGIGSLGKAAFDFVDFLEAAGQSYWQILPLGPTGYGDSPYQAYSTFAGNPYFIDLELLCQSGYLRKEECDAIDFGKNPDEIDYGKLYNGRFPLFKKALARFKERIPEDFEAFCKKQSAWLTDYALFMALKDENGGASFDKWEDDLKLHKRAALKKAEERLADEVLYWKMLQYFFYQQWNALKAYANKKGISIIGDVPIYVSPDSADVWASPEQFQLDENRKPIKVAGCPPDAFTADGQLWGNPLYRWDKMKEDGYAWWCKRLKAASKLYDVIRFDHFRGFEAYYTIPYGRKNARKGAWEKGPGIDFFKTIHEKLGKLDIIAEDLGFLTEGVYELLRETGYPGMKVIQFAFGAKMTDSEYLPHNFPKNCVAYTGTHDNETILGWLGSANAKTVKNVERYFRLHKDEGKNWAIMKGALATPANTVILQMQDFLGLDNRARVNEPSTLGKNWRWRVRSECINSWLANLILGAATIYFRTPPTAKAPVFDGETENK